MNFTNNEMCDMILIYRECDREKLRELMLVDTQSENSYIIFYKAGVEAAKK